MKRRAPRITVIEIATYAPHITKLKASSAQSRFLGATTPNVLATSRDVEPLTQDTKMIESRVTVQEGAGTSSDGSPAAAAQLPLYSQPFGTARISCG